MKKILILFVLVCEIAGAQNLSVLTNDKILNSDSKYYYPHFSPDGKQIVFTSQNFVGLYVLDMETKKTSKLTDKQGAGYKPVFSGDGSILFYRWNEYDGLKKYSSINSINLDSKQISVIETGKKNLSPLQVINNSLVYTIENKEEKRQIAGALKTANEKTIWTCIENQKIVIYDNNLKSVLAPKGDGNYIWPELSPDKTKILFTFAGHGTYISDLSGKIIAELGYLNASKWLNNNWVVGMKDYDDGDVVTESDLFAVSLNGQKSIQLTHTADEIEMHPDCLPESSRIVYHTLKGDIYLLTVKFE
ncbi:MAG: hypothetical protein K9H49_13400 [Bacteroidales bacterium]|nr:hypothetical protein [Bacteroidales bacterium]MCF8406187.1 hypothetical protein [Bacteroidales bacterium]